MTPSQATIGCRGDGAAGRIWPHIAWDESGSRLLLFGGHDDGALGNNNELWQFKPGSGNWKQLSAGDTFNNPASGVCDFPEDFTVIDPSAPERRSAAAWAASTSPERRVAAVCLRIWFEISM